MSYRSFSFIPALSSRLLSDRFTQMDNLFSRLTGEKPVTEKINYDLLQVNKNSYELTISVPGYNKEDLDISVLNNQLTITGKQEKIDESNEKKWLHKGIIKNGFNLSFNLEHKISINQADLDKGLLKLCFSYKIPEEKKPQKIEIRTKNSEPNSLTHNKIQK